MAVSPSDILEALSGLRYHINIEETVKESGRKRISDPENILIKGLSVQERRIYELLEILPKTPDELWQETGMTFTIQEVMGTLVELCLKGAAEARPEGYCQKSLAT